MEETGLPLARHRKVTTSARRQVPAGLKWFSTNYNVEVHAFVANGKYSVVNNTYEPQDTTVYTDNGSFDLHLEANEIRWYNL